MNRRTDVVQFKDNREAWRHLKKAGKNANRKKTFDIRESGGGMDEGCSGINFEMSDVHSLKV